MSGIEIFSIFGYFMFTMIVMAGAYVFIFGLIYVVSEKEETWLLATICFICVMSIYLTCEYSNANLRESRNITESEDVSDNNAGEIKNE